jgi:hypothetical protein
MEFVALVIIAIFVMLLVSYPLFGRQRQLHQMEDAFDFGDTRQLDFLKSKKASIENNIRELEFEHQMGKLSEQDYETLRQGYENEVGKIDQSLDKLRIKKNIEEVIEEEVRSRRRVT